MYPTSSLVHETKDVFNRDEFSVKGVFGLEHEPNRDFYFRWTEFYFSIKPKVKTITNVILNIYNIFPFKRLIIVTTNYRKEYNLLYGEYSFYIPICQNDQVDVFVSPTYVANDIRTNLGVCVKKIFVHELDYKYPKRLVDIEEVSNKIEFFNINEGADIYKRIKVPFEKQNGKLTILPLKAHNREFYFNPALFTLDGQDYLIARHTNVLGENVFYTELKMFKYPSLEPVDLVVNKDDPREQHEDPRALVYKDKIIISTVNYFTYKDDFFHEKLLIYDKNFNHEKSIHPVYGKNGPHVKQNTGDEKNWTFFEHDGKLMFVYQMSPHIVVETDLEGRIITEYKTHFDIKSKWKFGEVRLSTNPIYKDGYYHSFFHSHIPFREGTFLTKMYFMGYYKFRAEPPFDVIEVMEEPIIWGNDILPRREPLVPYCVFPCGVILKDDTFIISLGVNDEDCGILEYKLPS
jgi:predicted GH43/DUF377 family glycosyl hydrolase